MTRRGPYAKTATTREQALAAALKIIAERGLSSMTVQQIADELGLTKAGLLHHFGSREELLLAVIERSDQLNSIKFTDRPAYEGLIEVDRHNMEVPGLVQLLLGLTGAAAAERGDTRARQFFAERYRDFRDNMAAAVRRAQDDGTIRADLDAPLIAALITAASDGLQMQWLIDPSSPSIEGLEALAELLAPPSEPNQE